MTDEWNGGAGWVEDKAGNLHKTIGPETLEEAIGEAVGDIDVTEQVANAVASIVGAAPAQLDTLAELAAALGNNSDFAASVTTALAARQPLDSDLTAIAALSPANDDIIQRKAGAWTNRTMAQLMADLGLSAGSYQPLDTDLTAIAALATTPYGRSLLTASSAAALALALGAMSNPMTTVGDMIVASAGGDDLAQGKTGSNSDGFGTSSAALDGNPGTNWASNGGGPIGKWFQVDLGSALAVEKFRIVQNGNGAYSGDTFKLEYSNDGSAWTTSVATTGVISASDATYTLPAVVVARYWRLTVLNATGQAYGYQWFIFTFSLLSPAAQPTRLATTALGRSLLAPADAAAARTLIGAGTGNGTLVSPLTTKGDLMVEAGGSNIALAGTATASSVGDSCPPNLAIDNVTTGAESPLNSYNGTTPRIGWRSNGSGAGEWLQVDLGSAKTVGRTVVIFGQMGARRFMSHQLQYSTNGSTWTTLYSQPGYISVDDRSFTPVTARYWRVLCGASDGYGADIIEFQIMQALAEDRVAVGANGTVLTADSAQSTGIKWAAPALASGEVFVTAADVTMGTVNTFFDGPSQSLPAGTYLVSATVQLQPVSVAADITARLWDGTNVFAEGTQYASGGNAYVSITLSAIVTLASTTTVKMSAAANAGTAHKILKTVPANGTANKASKLSFVRVA